MRTHVSKVVSGCFAVLRRLRSIRSSVTRPVFVSLVVSLVLSRLDYGNATLAGITDRLTDRLRSVLNAAARLIHAARKTEHVTPLLRDLHWLRFPERLRGSSTNWRYWPIDASMDWGRATSPTNSSLCVGDRVTTASSVGFDGQSRRPSLSAEDTQRSCISCRRLKHGTAFRHMSHHGHL